MQIQFFAYAEEGRECGERRMAANARRLALNPRFSFGLLGAAACSAHRLGCEQRATQHSGPAQQM